MDAKVVNGSLFLLSGKKDKLLLYHCRDGDVDIEAAEEMDASNKVQVTHVSPACKFLSTLSFPAPHVCVCRVNSR